MLVYLAHPVGQDPVERKLNLENTQKWVKFLLDNTDWSLCVPWFVYVSTVDESYRERALRDDLINLERCDAIALTGGRLTGGMTKELGMAEICGQKVFDLTSVGYSPEDNLDLALKLIQEIAEAFPV